MTYVMGVDSSTTATKAVVWDHDGRAVAGGRGGFAWAAEAAPANASEATLAVETLTIRV